MAYGTLLGNPVMVVASGIGPTTAALCALELLQCRSGVHLTSLLTLANQVACLSCASLHTHTGLYILVHYTHAIPLFYMYGLFGLSISYSKTSLRRLFTWRSSANVHGA